MEIFVIALEIALIVAVGAYFLFSRFFEDKYRKIDELKKKNKYEEALKILLKMYQKDKDDTRVIYELAEINKELNNNLEAIGYYMKLIEKDVYPPVTTKGDVLKEIGVLYYKEHKIKEAFYFLYYASYFLPNDKDINYYLFYILLSNGFFSLAEKFGERALPFLSKNADFISDLAMVKLELNKYGDALELLEKAIGISKSRKVKIFLAFTLAKLGGYKRAIDLLVPITTEEGVPDELLFLVYMLIVYCNLNLKIETEVNKYWDVLLTFVTAKNLGDRIKEVGFGIFMSYLYFYKYSNAKEMLNTLKEYEISNSVIASIEPFIDDAIRNSQLKKEGKPYDIKPIREIDNFVQNWLNSMVKTEDIRKLYYTIASEQNRINVHEIIKQVQEKLEVENKKISSFMKDAGSGLTVEEEDDICDMFTNRLDSQTFSFICDELVKAMGFSIVKRLVTDTFVEGEGADYICTRPKDPSKYFIAVRRWGTNEIGKIAILDISQRATENNCDRVVIVSSAPLTSEAQEYVEKSKSVEFHTCKEMAVLLKSIIPSV